MHFHTFTLGFGAKYWIFIQILHTAMMYDLNRKITFIEDFLAYRDSLVSAVSISAVFDLVRFTNRTK